MGKPKYYTGQLLRNRSTGEIHYIKHISNGDASSGPISITFSIYTVPPISKAGQEKWTPNDTLHHWVITKHRLTKEYQVLNKKLAEPILLTMRLLYEQT